MSEILAGDRRFDLVVWYDEQSRSDPAVIGSTVLTLLATVGAFIATEKWLAGRSK